MGLACSHDIILLTFAWWTLLYIGVGKFPIQTGCMKLLIKICSATVIPKILSQYTVFNVYSPIHITFCKEW